MPATLEQVEVALDRGEGGHVWFWAGRNYWRARRNGKTQIFKRGPRKGQWRIPVKMGLKTYGELRPDLVGDYYGADVLTDLFWDWIIARNNPKEYFSKSLFEIMVLEKTND